MAFNSAKQQQDQNLLEDDQIYKEFSHQDLNQFLFFEKEKTQIPIDCFQNDNLRNSRNFNLNNKNNVFDNFPNNFQNPEKISENNKYFNNEDIPKPNQVSVDYTQFFNNEINKTPFKMKNENNGQKEVDQQTDFININQVENNVFDSSD